MSKKIIDLKNKIAKGYAQIHNLEDQLQKIIQSEFNLPVDSIYISYLVGDGVAVMSSVTDTGTPVESFIEQAKHPNFNINDFFTEL